VRCCHHCRSKAAAMNVDQQPAVDADVSSTNGDVPPSSTADNMQSESGGMYASVRKFHPRPLPPPTTDDSGGVDAEAGVGGVAYTTVEQSSDDSRRHHPTRQNRDNASLVKAALHDTDSDTDILARILARMSVSVSMRYMKRDT